MSIRRDELLPFTALVREKLKNSAKAFYIRQFDLAVRECEEATLLDEKNHLAWTRLGSAYYLMGDKAEGQGIFDRVIATKVKKDDWMRMGRVYVEAKEWDKAKAAFDKTLVLDPKDQGNLTEIGAWYNLHGDRRTAEQLFTRAFKSKPDEIWYTVNAAGSYVGVKPQ